MNQEMRWNSKHLKRRKAAFIRNWISMQDPLQTMIDDHQLLVLSNFWFSWIKHLTYFWTLFWPRVLPNHMLGIKHWGSYSSLGNTRALRWQQAQGRHTTKAHKAHPLHPISPTQESSVWGGEATKHHVHVLHSKRCDLDRIETFQIKEIMMAKNWK